MNPDMSSGLLVHLPAELEQQVAVAARQDGITPAEFILDAVVDSLASLGFEHAATFLTSRRERPTKA